VPDNPSTPTLTSSNAQSDQSLVTRQRDERGVVTLTMNRPEQFNALSEAMLECLQSEFDALAAIDGHSDARAVVLTGAGRHFCAGHDLVEMRAHPSTAYYTRLFEQCSALMLSIQRLSLPVIARVRGVATAAGCQLVAACDLAVASDDARFAVSGVNLGLFCSTPSVALARNVGRKQAMEMLLTGEFITAAQAAERGLVNRVVTPDQLDDAVDALVTAIVSKPRVAIAIGKRQFYRQVDVGIEQAYKIAGAAMAENMMHDDALEGVQAFIDKRSPAWRNPSD
jgi:enoyl-CoA hydratase/carnithine racemase